MSTESNQLYRKFSRTGTEKTRRLDHLADKRLDFFRRLKTGNSTAI